MLPHGVCERQPTAAQLGRHCDREITSLSKLLEVLGEKRVLAIVFGRAIRESREHLVGEKRAVAGAIVGVIGRHQRIRCTTPWDSS